MVVTDLIRDCAERHASRPALIELGPGGRATPGATVTYGALYEQTLRLCQALLARGLTPGDRIAVLLENSVPMVVTEWACLRVGFLWVSLNTRSSAEELTAILADSSPRVLFVADRYRSLLPAVSTAAGCEVITVGESSSAWDELIATGRAEEPSCAVSSEQPVRIRYTSGTAGRAKGAVLARRCYDASVESVADVIGPVSGADVLLQVAPMTHASGAMLLPHVAAGACALLARRFDVGEFIDVVERFRVSSVFLVPTMLVRLLERVDDRAPLSCLKTIVYGGASMPVDRLRTGLELLGPVFVQIYGLTESTWPVTVLRRDDHMGADGLIAGRERLASCGRPTPVGEVRVVDAAGRDVVDGASGELWVRGRNTMLGYWRGGVVGGDRPPDDEKGLDGDGWMHTGDVAVRDAEGFVTIVDRLHDMIVSGGFNVYPREVEDALSTHEAVLESAVVGRPSREWGEAVHAFVVLRDGASAGPDELIAHCGRHVAAYKKPKSIELVDELPKNAAGKILRRRLRERTG